MAQTKITEKETAKALLETAYVLVTQQEKNEDGTTLESLRRVPLSVFFSELYNARKDNNNDAGEEVIYPSVGDFLRSVSKTLAELTPCVTVSVTYNEDGTYTANKTYLELYDAYRTNKTLRCRLQKYYLQLNSSSVSEFVFSAVIDNYVYQVNIGYVQQEETKISVKKIDLSSCCSETITPHIGDNGNWFIGETDTGMPSRGETGPSGVHIGSEAPTDDDVNVWIDPDAEGNALDFIATPATASVGQTIVVKEVDENGKPTAWETADLSAPQEAILYTPQALTDEQKAQARDNIGAGGAFSDSPMELIVEGVTTEQVHSATITLDNDGQPFELQDFYLIWKAKTISVAGTGSVVGHIVLHSNETQVVLGDSTVGWRAADTLSEKPSHCYFNIGHFVFSRQDSGSNYANSAVASKLNNIIQYPITGISVSMTAASELFEVGATYQLYGRRVKK